ncbi:gelsolin-related protein of 125 kDa-like [Helianthus annuus]|uniref:gelsolin-related protein of 125 kDa-like n=1 Tax=Helianthus annuus TaxID=4232 RepID=UPI000B8F64A1|nr:gelsolin-related protein of 125 kDa-like [Helianthus annuus]
MEEKGGSKVGADEGSSKIVHTGSGEEENITITEQNHKVCPFCISVVGIVDEVENHKINCLEKDSRSYNLGEAVEEYRNRVLLKMEKKAEEEMGRLQVREEIGSSSYSASGKKKVEEEIGSDSSKKTVKEEICSNSSKKNVEEEISSDSSKKKVEKEIGSFSYSVSGKEEIGSDSSKMKVGKEMGSETTKSDSTESFEQELAETTESTEPAETTDNEMPEIHIVREILIAKGG